MSKLRATLPYALVQGTLWALFAILMNYSSNFLYVYGFSDSQISLVLGGVMVAAFGLQLLSAELISRIPALKTWGVLTAFALGIGLCALGMEVWKNSPVPAIGCFALACVLMQTLPALANSLGMDAVERGAPTVYGVARGTGSLLNGTTALLLGQFIGRAGNTLLSWAAVAVAGALLIGVVWFHLDVEGHTSELPQNGAVRNQHAEGFLKQNPRFLLFLAGATLLCFSQNLMNNFLLQVMNSRGGDASHQGAAGSLAALAEIPVMFLFPLMLRKISSGRWMRLSALFFVIKSVITLCAATPFGAVAAQGTQMMGYGLFAISSVIDAGEIVGEGEAVRAQSYLASTLTLGNLAAMSLGGVIIQYLGVDTMIVIAAASAAVGGGVLVLEAKGK